MIHYACVSPRIFERRNDPDGDAHFALVIALLKELEENCAVLVDDTPDRVTTSAITRNVREWPIKYRPLAQELLRRMRDQRRFVKVRNASSEPVCGGQPCRFAVGIAGHESHDVVVASRTCSETVAQRLRGSEVVTPTTYSTSKFSRRRAHSRVIDVPHASVSVSQAEAEIFWPLFRAASHVTIVDRYIGRSTAGDGNGKANFSRDYERSIEWFLRMHRAGAGSDPNATFEVWCGLETYRLEANDVANAVAELRQWEKRVVDSGVNGFKLHIKEEKPEASLPHARYLSTGQISILIERGFNLLLSDSQMRTVGKDPRRDERLLAGTVIAVYPQAGKVHAAIRRLRDL